MKDFLDFYEKLNVSPVFQHIDDMAVHFNRRAGLYNQLGLNPLSIKGSSIIEVGPGTGQNAIYTASLEPTKLHFIEGNSASITALNSTLVNDAFKHIDIQIFNNDFYDVNTDQCYDIVLAEGLIPGQSEPERFFKKAQTLVNTDGIIVITNITSMSHLSEICRRLVLPFYAKHYEGDMLLDKLVTLFKPHLDSLQFASRDPKDWVIDSILHPWQDMRFSIDDAINALSDEFEFLASQPVFFQDWRWHKTFVNNKNAINELAQEQYLQTELNLIDHRLPNIKTTITNTQKIKQKSDQLLELHKSFLNDPSSNYSRVITLIEAIATDLDEIAPCTSQALRDFIIALHQLAEGNLAPEFGTFVNFWGRGQQYSSYIKK